MSFLKLFEEFVNKKEVDSKSKLSILLSDDDQERVQENEKEDVEDDGGVSIKLINIFMNSNDKKTTICF